MKIAGMFFEVNITPKEEGVSEEVKELIIKLSDKFKTNIENGLKEFELKKNGDIFNYRTKRYSALVSQIGGFIRTISEQEISAEDIAIFQKIFEPFFIEFNENIRIRPHLSLVLNGNFQNVVNKFEIEKKLNGLKLNVEIEHSGILITALDGKIPVELEVIPKRIEAKVCYCVALKEHTQKTNLNITQSIDFVKKSVEELNK